MPRAVRVLSLSELPSGSGREVVAAGVLMAIFRSGSEFYAIEGLCPHAGGSLGNGMVNGHCVTCPRHGLEVDFTTGAHALSETPLRTFRAFADENDVFVELDND